MREKRFLVEGAKNVLELLSSDFEIELVASTESFLEKVGEVGDNRVEIVHEALLEQLGTFKTNNSVIAVAKQREELPFDRVLTDHLFVLDGVGDPGNLGTIIRTLDWFGFTHLLCSSDCAEFYHPKTISSTMGSFVRLNVHYDDLAAVLGSLSMPIYGATMEGSNMYDLDIEEPSVIIMGSESHGIRPDTHAKVTQTISIPRHGKAESLNVGIATGIIAGYLRNA